MPRARVTFDQYTRSDSQRDTPPNSPVAQRITPHEYPAGSRATLMIDQSRIFTGRKQHFGSPLAASSVGSPPGTTLATLRVRRYASALRVCGQAPSRL
jgi:hypothetical protein